MNCQECTARQSPNVTVRTYSCDSDTAECGRSAWPSQRQALEGTATTEIPVGVHQIVHQPPLAVESKLRNWMILQL